MSVMIKGFIKQDTLTQKLIVPQDTIKRVSDSSALKTKKSLDSVFHVKTSYTHPALKIENIDTTSTCHRNSIADVTFYDSTNILFQINGGNIQNFPFVFTGINRKFREETNANLVSHLRSGAEIPSDFFHNDWALPIIFLSVLIYGVIKADSGKFFKGILKFISFRGINESSSRDIGGLFQWQSTLFNLASFMNISLFAFFTSIWYNVFPSAGKSFFYWLLSFAIIISSVTLRHFICIFTGNMSEEKDIFLEYLIGIYQAYRLAGLFLLVITVLILYTAFIPVNILFYIGFSLVSLLYIIRVFRLFLIFTNRHASIFYLILYLCALEILPVVILVKYVTGLI
jgi:hypothetical protein